MEEESGMPKELKLLLARDLVRDATGPLFKIGLLTDDFYQELKECAKEVIDEIDLAAKVQEVRKQKGYKEMSEAELTVIKEMFEIAVLTLLDTAKEEARVLKELTG